jgi:methyltransferase (TIGR00027 family)
LQRSLIAGANAWFRAAESKGDPRTRILVDPWAERLAERDLRVEAVRFARFVVPPLGRLVDELRTVHCVRHRTVDELVLAAARDGHEQLVILGAGYDMRASRFSRELSGVRVFEVDRPEVLARKRQLLSRERGLSPVTAIALDLSRESLLDALVRAGLDASASTCFVAEGFVHYLSKTRFDALLAEIARGEGRRRVILSFIRDEMFGRASPLFVELVRGLREIPSAAYGVDELRARLAAHGFSSFESFDLAAQIARFAPMAKGRRAGVSQDVAVAERR